MSTGLLALLDDVAALAKTAAATLDDIAGQAAKAGAKSAGVVIDDAAVTPRYVVGFASDRELPIVLRIARGSLFNKLVILLPGALLLSLLAPWAVNPLLMLGGLFLCYEGAEKVFEALFPHAAHAHEDEVLQADSAEELEERRVNGAIKTDFILSAEIMAIALSTVTDSSLLVQAVVLALVALFITFGVYGAVALIVRADDMGVALAQREGQGALRGATRSLGRFIVVAMPQFLRILSTVGTAAMIWVGGGILVHGLTGFGVAGPEAAIHHAAEALAGDAGAISGFLTWLVGAAASGVIGLVVGFLLIPVVGKIISPLWQRFRPRRGSADQKPH
ncbi:MAG: DUF808 domain-containing protein [Xanthomonadales bacterium]|nr:DUF808 domain-containing protein [Xanthomonadales bacterium]